MIFALLLAGYLGILSALRAKGGHWRGFEATGPFIMWRTQFGKRTIERMAAPRRFWEGVADVGIVATWIVGALMLLLVVLNAVLTIYLTYIRPRDIADSAQPPQNFLGLPGVNPFIPLGYGLLALVVALVIHEGSHALMAYVSRIRVKSSGLLFFVVPIGAFVEPDEVDLEKATPRQRLRVFAAGPASNFLVALVAGLLLSATVVAGVGYVNDGKGVVVAQLVDGSPAEAAGLQAGDVLVRMGSMDVAAYADFQTALSQRKAGESMQVAYLRGGGEPREAIVAFADKYEFYARDSPESNREEFRGQAFLGVQAVGMDTARAVHAAFANPFASGDSFLLFTQFPLIAFLNPGLNVFSPTYSPVYDLQGPFAGWSPDAFYTVVYILFWIVWIDLTLGVFNALPAGPLDGGQMLRTVLRARLYRRYGVDEARIDVSRPEPAGGIEVKGRDDETQGKLDRVQVSLRKVTRTVGYSILLMLLLPILGPHIVGLFA